MKSLYLKANLAGLITLLFAFDAICFAQEHQHQGGGQGQQQRMMGQGQPGDMQTIHSLLDNNQKITRTIKKISNGIETVTESNDAAIRAKIVEHTWAMKARLEKHQPIRMWDPLFAELFKYADQIKLEISNTAKGVKVIETSTDNYVVKLIQAHAQGVSEFVKEGSSIMHKPHSLPGEAPKTEAKFLGKGDGVTTCPVTGEPIDKNINAQINGRTVYFCCANCRDTVVKNPALYLKPTNTEATMNVLKLQTEIGEGKDKQVDTLFEGARRKVQQLTLRNRAVLAAHKASEPITIQCIAGQGVIRIGEEGETIELRPGVLLTLEPNITHAVEALPAVSILLTRFTEK
jgi:quercetin dioxygenase-like cupin family protein